MSALCQPMLDTVLHVSVGLLQNSDSQRDATEMSAEVDCVAKLRRFRNHCAKSDIGC